MTRQFTLTLGAGDFILQLDRGIGEHAFRQLSDAIVTWLGNEGVAVLPVNNECDSALGKYVYEVRGAQWQLTVAQTLKQELPVRFAEDEIELHIAGLK